MKTETIANMCGGAGEVVITHLLGAQELNEKCGLFAQVTIAPGSSLGYHEHHGESETYYILSGDAEYDDNGKTRIVHPGDVTHTPDGCGHALKPIGDAPVVFIALIILG
ncbi:MAG: cupin domain-containing protein [Gemmiger sp.]|nr:cupin domain-containing protein [Gemmiger sp.]